MLSIANAREVARYAWPNGSGETIVYRSERRYGGGFFMYIRGPWSETIAPCTPKAALDLVAHCSRILKAPRS